MSRKLFVWMSVIVVLSMLVLPTVALAQGPDNSNKPGPTTAEAKQLIGLDVQRISTEWSAFTRRTFPESETAICPINAVCTFHTTQNGVDSGVKIFVGDDQKREEMALTVRFVSFYPSSDAVHNVCLLMAKEELNGKTDNPSFTVEAGNFTCDAQNNPQVTTIPAVTPISQPTPVVVTNTSCPAFKINDDVIETQPLTGNDTGNCKLKTTSPIRFIVPNGWNLSYWDGNATKSAKPGDDVTTGDATFIPVS